MPSATPRDVGVAAIFGDPVAHSKSPAMHNAAYAALGMNRTYAAFRVTPANLAAALRAVVPLGIVGVNLTVPHKEVAARYLKDLSAEARMLGAQILEVAGRDFLVRHRQIYSDDSERNNRAQRRRQVGRRDAKCGVRPIHAER